MKNLSDSREENPLMVVEENDCTWSAPKVCKFSILNDTAGGSGQQLESNHGALFGS
jgi:hypothetical protein